jgi:XapX domain-containing protein
MSNPGGISYDQHKYLKSGGISSEIMLKPQSSNMTELLLALLAGLLVGIVFSAIKLPLPAPPVLTGVAGIVGIYLGGVLFQWAMQAWFRPQ